MKKTLTYSSFVAIGLLVILAFVTADTYTQLGIAVILYPILVYFAYKLFVDRKSLIPKPAVNLTPQDSQITKNAPTENTSTVEPEVGETDIDKRTFLKLIGAAGISFFLFSLFNRRADTLFLGRLPGADQGVRTPSQQEIDDSIQTKKDPTEGYQITEIDESDTTFYGFTDKDGGWYIMKADIEGSFRYTKGDSDFAGNWSNRENLNYTYYHEVF